MITCEICGSTEGTLKNLFGVESFELPARWEQLAGQRDKYACTKHVNRKRLFSRRDLRAGDREIRLRMRQLGIKPTEAGIASVIALAKSMRDA